MGKLKLKEILERLKKEGISISKRTFEFYQRIGLLPKPTTKEVGHGGRGVYGYYDDTDVIKRVKDINRLKEQGYTLARILELMKDNVIGKYEDFRNKFGLSDTEALAFPPHLAKSMSPTDILPTSFLEANFFEKLPSWTSEKEIETSALNDINQEAHQRQEGLRIALNLCNEEKNKFLDNEEAQQIFSELMGNLKEEINKLEKLRFEVTFRLAEILREKKHVKERKRIFKNAGRNQKLPKKSKK
jgi:DNA-binding transcriptional MerR regulator